MLRRVQTLMVSMFLLTGLTAFTAEFTAEDGLATMREVAQVMDEFAEILVTVVDVETAHAAVPGLEAVGTKIKRFQQIAGDVQGKVMSLPEAEQLAFTKESNRLMMPVMIKFMGEAKRLQRNRAVMEVIDPVMNKLR